MQDYFDLAIAPLVQTQCYFKNAMFSGILGMVRRNVTVQLVDTPSTFQKWLYIVPMLRAKNDFSRLILGAGEDQPSEIKSKKDFVSSLSGLLYANKLCNQPDEIYSASKIFAIYTHIQ